MKDLFFTSRGDLAIEDINDTRKRLEINFLTSKSNALQLNFFISDTYQKNNSLNSLLINFNIETPLYNKEIRLINGDQAIEQAIKIRLLSSMNSIVGNKDIGSKLELIVHKFLDLEDTEQLAIKYIAEAIRDIIPNPSITIKKINSKYTDYSNGFNVVIIDKDKKYNIKI